MAYVPYTDATRDLVTDKPERKRTGFFRRLVNAMYVSRQLRVASVARYFPSTTRMLEMGADHILFAVDWPFVMNPPAVEWMQNVSISDSDKVKILSGNAQRLLKM